MAYSEGLQSLAMDANAFDDGELFGLSYFAAQIVTPQAEALGIGWANCLQREIQRRIWNYDNPESPQEVEELEINLTGWSDVDIGKGLEATGRMEQSDMDPRIREVASALHAVLVLAAAERLANSGDERNQTGFLERHGYLDDEDA